MAGGPDLITSGLPSSSTGQMCGAPAPAHLIVRLIALTVL